MTTHQIFVQHSEPLAQQAILAQNLTGLDTNAWEPISNPKPKPLVLADTKDCEWNKHPVTIARPGNFHPTVDRALQKHDRVHVLFADKIVLAKSRKRNWQEVFASCNSKKRLYLHISSDDQAALAERTALARNLQSESKSVTIQLKPPLRMPTENLGSDPKNLFIERVQTFLDHYNPAIEACVRQTITDAESVLARNLDDIELTALAEFTDDQRQELQAKLAKAMLEENKGLVWVFEQARRTFAFFVLKATTEPFSVSNSEGLSAREFFERYLANSCERLDISPSYLTNFSPNLYYYLRESGALKGLSKRSR